MVAGDKPPKLLTKVPVPVPLVVLVSKLMVGFGEVDHTTPRSVTDSPPSEEILPPEVAVIDEMELGKVVVIIGIFVLRHLTEAPTEKPAGLDLDTKPALLLRIRNQDKEPNSLAFQK